MRLLLDTSVFLCSQTSRTRLGGALALLEDLGNELLVSAVVGWEVALKAGVGRLPLPEPPERFVPERIRRIGARTVPVELDHALRVAALPPLHRDPFDRLLVAQALALDATLLTGDRLLARYPAKVEVVGCADPATVPGRSERWQSG